MIITAQYSRSRMIDSCEWVVCDMTGHVILWTVCQHSALDVVDNTPHSPRTATRHAHHVMTTRMNIVTMTMMNARDGLAGTVGTPTRAVPNVQEHQCTEYTERERETWEYWVFRRSWCRLDWRRLSSLSWNYHLHTHTRQGRPPSTSYEYS